MDRGAVMRSGGEKIVGAEEIAVHGEGEDESRL